MEMLRDANWVLSVGTFLPLAGVVLLLGVPKANEQMVKMVALLTSLTQLQKAQQLKRGTLLFAPKR